MKSCDFRPDIVTPRQLQSDSLDHEILSASARSLRYEQSTDATWPTRLFTHRTSSLEWSAFATDLYSYTHHSSVNEKLFCQLAFT